MISRASILFVRGMLSVLKSLFIIISADFILRYLCACSLLNVLALGHFKLNCNLCTPPIAVSFVVMLALNFHHSSLIVNDCVFHSVYLS